MARCDYTRCRRRALFVLRVDDGGQPFTVGVEVVTEHRLQTCAAHLKHFLAAFCRQRKIIAMI